MIERESQIKELYDLRHRKDVELHTHFDWENNMLQKMVSSRMYNNPIMSDFLDRYQKLLVWMYESNVVVRNLYNFCVSRYYNRYNN
jgi:hypothetical protein